MLQIFQVSSLLFPDKFDKEQVVDKYIINSIISIDNVVYYENLMQLPLMTFRLNRFKYYREKGYLYPNSIILDDKHTKVFITEYFNKTSFRFY